jgi:hypothetical protein
MENAGMTETCRERPLNGHGSATSVLSSFISECFQSFLKIRSMPVAFLPSVVISTA